MKKLLSLALLFASAATFYGCATVASPVMGGIYTDVKAPITATTNSKGSKIGTATATSILGLIATGDASIHTAAKNGGITNIRQVDYHSTSILGIYATFTVEVHGD